MKSLDPEYPTEEQMRELYEARKKPGAIAELLHKRRMEREEVEAKKGKELSRA